MRGTEIDHSNLKIGASFFTTATTTFLREQKLTQCTRFQGVLAVLRADKHIFNKGVEN